MQKSCVEPMNSQVQEIQIVIWVVLALCGSTLSHLSNKEAGVSSFFGLQLQSLRILFLHTSSTFSSSSLVLRLPPRPLCYKQYVPRPPSPNSHLPLFILVIFSVS